MATADLPEDPRELYVTSDALSLRALARLYKGQRGCSQRNLELRSKKEGWDRLRREWRSSVAQKARDEESDKRAEIVARQLRHNRDAQHANMGLVIGAAQAIERFGGIDSLFVRRVMSANGEIHETLDRAAAIAGIRAGTRGLSLAQLRERELMDDAKDYAAELLDAATKAYDEAQQQLPDGQDHDTIRDGQIHGPETTGLTNGKPEPSTNGDASP